MKREHSNPNPNPNPNPSHQNRHHVAAATSSSACYLPPEKSPNIWPDDCCDSDGGMDELLAMLGYKVRASDMADVAQRLTQLDEAMCSVQNDSLSNLASDSVHYNPSELSTWLDTMIADLTPPPCFDSFMSSSSAAAESSTVTTVFDQDSSSSDYDLKAIPGKAIIYNDNNSSSSSYREPKRLKPYTAAAPPPPPPQKQQIVLVDSQENGIRLVHALMACAEAVQSNSLPIAGALVKQINVLAASQAGAMRKVATYFYQALVHRIYALSPENPAADHSLSDFLQIQFYETCPYLKFAHFTANQAILEAFQGKSRVHVIDFSMNQGMQWPALMQALALRPGGPPSFRLTGIGPPAHDNADYLQEVGWKLAQLAESIHVEFEYRGFVANTLADLDSAMLELRPSESVAVNSVFELHKLLARPGAIEKVLSVVKRMKPEILTVVEQEANHNGPVFLDRFTEALHYYSTMFDSLEGSSSSSPSPSSSSAMMAEVYLGKQIANVVACEGVDRVERHETMEQWKDRFESAGFGPAHLGSNAFKQASMLLALYAGGDGYEIEEKNGCLTLGWHSRQLIATSAWKLNEPGRVGSD